MSEEIPINPAAPDEPFESQLDAITTSRLAMEDGYALPPAAAGLGIEWDHAAIDRAAVSKSTVTKRN